MEVTQSKEFHNFFRSETYSKTIFTVEEKTSKYIEAIMKSRPNVTSVTFSPVKSIGFGTSKKEFKEEPCIVFSVGVKFNDKRVPLGSEEIPKEINGVPTDIREGIVEPLMQNAQVGFACNMFSYVLNGTQGPFFCSQNGKTGFISCLHALLSTDNLKMTSETYETHVKLSSEHEHFVHNPGTGERIGILTKYHYVKGNNETIGYEFGLVELLPGIHVEDGMLF